MTYTLTQDEITQVLNRELIGRLGCSANRQSYIVPISYAYDGKFIYARSREGQKIKMMRANPNVCLEIDNIVSMVSWQCVVIQGTYEEVTSALEQNKILKLINDKFTPLQTSSTLAPHGFEYSPTIIEKEKKAIVFRIRITKVTGRYEKPG